MNQVSKRPNVLGVHSVDHFALDVPDLGEARRFYETFGLDVRDENGGLALYTKDHPHRWGTLRQVDGPKRLRYLSFGIFEEDQRAFEKHLDALGVEHIPAPDGVDSNGIWFTGYDGLPINVRVAEKASPDTKSIFGFESSEPGLSGAIPNSKAPRVHPRRL